MNRIKELANAYLEHIGLLQYIKEDDAPIVRNLDKLLTEEICAGNISGDDMKHLLSYRIQLVSDPDSDSLKYNELTYDKFIRKLSWYISNEDYTDEYNIEELKNFMYIQFVKGTFTESQRSFACKLVLECNLL